MCLHVSLGGCQISLDVEAHPGSYQIYFLAHLALLYGMVDKILLNLFLGSGVTSLSILSTTQEDTLYWNVLYGMAMKDA